MDANVLNMGSHLSTLLVGRQWVVSRQSVVTGSNSGL